MRKNEIAACACIVLGIGAAFATAFIGEGGLALLPHKAEPTPAPTPVVTPTPTPTPEPQPVVETVHFSATGDDLIHSRIYQQAKERAKANGGEGYDFSFCYQNMRDFYSQFDVNWLNQETLVNDTYAPSTYPTFSTPGDIAKALYDVGFRVFSMSNNHSYDKGAGGLTATREFWATQPEDVVTMGIYNLETYDEYAYQTVNGITFGYLSYTEHTNGLPTPSGSEYGVIYLNQQDIIAKQIADMRPNCDVLVVSCHWGVEDSHTIVDSQREMAQWLADQGVDLIIGTHPHVAQSAEWLSAADGTDAFVAYSLGNFISTQKRFDNLVGLILDITFEKTTQPDGSWTLAIQAPQLHPIVTHYGASYRDVCVYLLRDYPDELGATHGNAKMDQASILNMLEDAVDPQYLAVDGIAAGAEDTGAEAE